MCPFITHVSYLEVHAGRNLVLKGHIPCIDRRQPYLARNCIDIGVAVRIARTQGSIQGSERKRCNRKGNCWDCVFQLECEWMPCVGSSEGNHYRWILCCGHTEDRSGKSHIDASSVIRPEHRFRSD